jgi:hypothetical protein
MSATIDDLTKGLETFFAQHFPAADGGRAGSMALVFDGLGTPLAEREFIGSDQGAAENLLSHQRAAQLADQLPAGNALRSGWYLPRSGSRLSTWYEALLAGAASTGSGEASVSAFEQRRYAARRKLEANKLAAVSGSTVGGSGGTVDASGTVDDYYATGMTPVGWYSADAACWASYGVEAPVETSSTGQAGGTHSSSGGSSGPLVPPDRPAWLVSAPSFSLRTTDDNLVSESPALSHFARTAIEEQTVELAVENRPSHFARTAITRQGASNAFRARRLRPYLAEAAQAAAEPAQGSTLGQLVAASKVRPEMIVAATTQRPVTSDGFSVSFRYCMVRFTRPWWDDVFLGAGEWGLPGYGIGTLSSGAMAEPQDPLTMITAGMIVIKDLKLKASWSEDDLSGLRDGVSLGPFSLAGATLPQTRNGVLERPGMQAIAWLCEVLPVLPPAAT